MTDAEIELEKWNILKEVVSVSRQNTDQIAAIFRLHWGLVAAIRYQFGLPEAEPMPEVVDAASMARLQSGIDELEAMFQSKPNDEKDGDS